MRKVKSRSREKTFTLSLKHLLSVIFNWLSFYWPASCSSSFSFLHFPEWLLTASKEHAWTCSFQLWVFRVGGGSDGGSKGRTERVILGPKNGGESVAAVTQNAACFIVCCCHTATIDCCILRLQSTEELVSPHLMRWISRKEINPNVYMFVLRSLKIQTPLFAVILSMFGKLSE